MPYRIGLATSGRLSDLQAATLRRFSRYAVAAAVCLAVGLVVSDAATTAARLAGVACAVAALAATVAAARTFIGFLRTADEPTRAIQLEAFAIGFAAGIAFSVGYGLLERLGAPSLPMPVNLAVMVIAWAVGQHAGLRRLRATIGS
jgi:drug/metabolite transporter (DMT)-like permease